MTKEHVIAYAEITGDMNPLHFDEEFASATTFGGLITHGGIQSGALNALVAMKLPGPGSVFLNQELAYKKPVRVGDTLKAHGKVTWVHATKVRGDGGGGEKRRRREEDERKTRGRET